MPDIDINEGVRSLNSQQREVFESVHSWAKRFLKYQNCIVPKKVEPLHLFVTGNAGTGKSFLINLLFDHLTKLFSYHNPDKGILSALTGHFCFFKSFFLDFFRGGLLDSLLFVTDFFMSAPPIEDEGLLVIFFLEVRFLI